MIVLPGTLRTKVINGRNGDFIVGTLITQIGEFAIKDPILEQYPEGEFQGRFGIAKIYPSSYAWAGGIKVEVRAILESIDIDMVEEKEIANEPEPDPIDDEAQQEPATTPDDKPSGDASDTKEAKDDKTLDLSILGDIELTDQVKLDPTVDRLTFREQCLLLGKLGYEFDATKQVWNRQ